jgi:glutaredoxin
MIFKVITTKGCSYCQAAKSLLTQNNLDYEELDAAEASELIEKSYMRSFPIIFEGEDLVGGFTDLFAKLHPIQDID